jgi:hypothetical protein
MIKNSFYEDDQTGCGSAILLLPSHSTLESIQRYVRIEYKYGFFMSKCASIYLGALQKEAICFE